MAFESVVADLFEAVGFRVARSHIIAVKGRRYEIDLIATGSGGQVLVVEIKAYRSRTPVSRTSTVPPVSPPTRGRNWVPPTQSSYLTCGVKPCPTPTWSLPAFPSFVSMICLPPQYRIR
jgi:hypothetical protein